MSSQTLSTSCSCSIDRLLQREESYIFITGSHKQSDAAGKSYTTYNIRIDNEIETKHRYSEFESLRKSLVKLHPTVIVPPIPEKHSLVDYAALQTRVKSDDAMVEKRKRMLESFLNRVAKHPDLCRDHVFHRFLESNVPWADVLHSPPLSNLPKDPLKMFASKNAETQPQTQDNPLNSSLIPTPSSTYMLKNPDPQFEESEKFTYRIANYMSNNLDKSQRKVIRRLGELAEDYSELGAVYNGFSLNETAEVANAIENIGKAVDSSCTETRKMVQSLEQEFAEPIQEHSQFAQTIKQVLKFRHLKHAQVEMIESYLRNNKKNMQVLIEHENVARDLEEAMERERTIGSNAVDFDELGPTAQQDEPSDEQNPYGHPYSPDFSPSIGRRQRGWNGPVRMMNAAWKRMSETIDVDPVATRRSQIGKTKDAIGVLEKALEVARNDLTGVSVDIQEDLDRFQREKIKNLRDMLIKYARNHIQYCEKNLEYWKEARAEVDNIPNQFH